CLFGCLVVFFQAEDGIRDFHVTGVQTCALPISVARLLARELGWHMLDSGALYRLLALAAGDHGISLEDEAALAELAPRLDIRFSADENDQELVLLDGGNVTDRVRSEETGGLASRIAAFPRVREALVQRQRDFRTAPGLVADGRDMGTVIFPDANAKIYLTATAEARALRRHKQLNDKENSASLTALFREISARDERDAN